MSEKGFLADAIQLIIDKSRPATVKVGDCTYRTDNFQQLMPKEPDMPVLKVNTLSGLVSVIQEEIDQMDGRDCCPLLIRVESPRSVTVTSTLHSTPETLNLRQLVYVCENDNAVFECGEYGQENMVILLRSMFQQTPDRDYLLDLISRIDTVNGVSITDNGLTQAVEMRTGVQLKDSVPIKPIVTLRPYRTFLEVDQPTSDFLLRVSKSGAIRLREADGGAWKLEARMNIQQYLMKNLPESLFDAGQVAVML